MNRPAPNQQTGIARRLRNLVLPARPDPARSRRIAEVRLVIFRIQPFIVAMVRLL